MGDEIEKSTVKWFDSAKGFGFIVDPKDEKSDIFVHFRSIESEGYKELKEGEQVSFVRERSEKGFSATKVKKL